MSEVSSITTTPEGLALPCPRCEYDLRGLGDGRCPECGASFRVEDLVAEEPGLALEQWVESARTIVRRAMIPPAIAFAPAKAFRRQCRLENALILSPKRMLGWLLGWCVLLVLFSVGVHYGLDRLLRIRLVLGSYWNSGFTTRFQSAVLLPVDLVITSVQCLAVTFLGMVIAARRLSARQAVRLATWLLALALLGGLFAVCYKQIWNWLIDPWTFRQMSDWSVCIRNVAEEVLYRGHDCVLGFAGGFAVGTVLQRRRWVIALVSAAVLVAGFPAYLNAQRVYFERVHWPVRVALFGTPTPPPRGPDLLSGPTFTVGTAEPTLAGTWSVHYEEAEQGSTELVFDSSGTLVECRARSEGDSSGTTTVFVADGLDHPIELPENAPKTAEASYRVLSGSQRTNDNVVIHLRLERSYTGYWPIPVPVQDVAEETLIGIVDADESVIRGTSVYTRQADMVNFSPNLLERPIVMRRMDSTTHRGGP